MKINVTKDHLQEMSKELGKMNDALLAICCGGNCEKHINTISFAAARMSALAEHYEHLFAEAAYQAEKNELKVGMLVYYVEPDCTCGYTTIDHFDGDYVIGDDGYCVHMDYCEPVKDQTT